MRAASFESEHTMGRALLALLAALCLAPFFWPSPASAGEQQVWSGEIYTGISADTEGQGIGYVGGGLARSVRPQWAYTGKFFLSYLQYEFDSEGRTIEAEAPGVKLQAGVKYSDARTYLVLTAGLDYRDTDLSPDDRSVEVRGSQTGFVVEAVYGRELTEKIGMELIGSYSTLGDTFWGRGRVKHLIESLSDPASRKVLAGMEVVGQGSEDYAAFSLGGLLELRSIRKHSSVLAAAGWSNNDGIPDSAYVRLEFYHPF
jgi:hypothetical protein